MVDRLLQSSRSGDSRVNIFVGLTNTTIGIGCGEYAVWLQGGRSGSSEDQYIGSGLGEVLCPVSTRPVASSCTLGGTRFIMRQWHDILTLAESSLALLYRDETETEVQVELRHFDVQVAQRT